MGGLGKGKLESAKDLRRRRNLSVKLEGREVAGEDK